jgi:hypothetical protein
VIMYFAITYQIWSQLTGRAANPDNLAWQRRQLWLWGIGMMVMTLPWHWLGLEGQWRRVAHFDYENPLIAWWGAWVNVSLLGGVMLLISALLFIHNLAGLHGRQMTGEALQPMRYAIPLHPVARVPAALNGFALWNVLVLVLMAAAYGWPIGQFIVQPSRLRSSTTSTARAKARWTENGGSGERSACWPHWRSAGCSALSCYRLCKAGLPGSTPSPRSVGRSASYPGRRPGRRRPIRQWRSR